ncbi:doublecortin domain-containing protein 2-like isoform X1 [Triplophysa dalaica]|uniref:doublecortin domain-containing protein 2-like isoform X1 n=1 Tax=Triplophysa dalaica TaxID=1582913 RepID=UPI0024DFBD11|nr:doublecortin domain-containing protein 2-like isoform X1 [Triplophysa dalaica]
MSAEKPNFLSQPEVKNIYFYRNGDPYYEPRRLVVNAKRVSTFDTLLREVTGGVRAPFGAVRNIYTPKAGHRVDSLEHLRSGEQYVAAGREKFKKIDYLQIGNRKKRTPQSNGLMKPIPQSRMIVSARFLKPIKEPCAIFVVANGDVLNPVVRLLIPSRVIGQFERTLEMITEKIGLRIVGGVRSLYTFEGTLITDGKELENGQFYVAVGRDKFKKLPYSDLLFSKPIGMKRVNGSKAASLPPICKYRRQNGDVGNHVSKSVVGGSEYGQDKSSPPSHSSKEHLSSLVREISQAKLMNIRKKRSGLMASHDILDDDDGEDKSAEDDKFSPEVGEVSPDPNQEKNSQEQANIDDSSKTEEQNQTTEAKNQTTVEKNQTTEEQDQTTEKQDQTTEEKEEQDQTTEEQDQTTEKQDQTTEEKEEKDQTTEEQDQTTEEQKQTMEEHNQTTEEQNQTTQEQRETTEEQDQTTKEQNQPREEQDQITKDQDQAREEQDQTTCNGEEEQNQEDVNAEDENKETEDSEKYEFDGEIKEEEETSDPEAKDVNKEKCEADEEERQNEEQQLKGEEETNDEKPENEKEQTEESPDQSESQTNAE